MKWCVTFQDEDILIKRPCLRKACAGNKPAASVLSYLLYLVSISQEYKRNADNINKRREARGEEPTQDVSINIYRTQLEIIAEMDNEMSDRTLRDTALPLLVALGYITVDESDRVNIYTVYLDAVQDGINTPPKISEVLPMLQHRIQDGSTSDKHRKYFRRLAEILPTVSGNTSDVNGNTSDGKKQGKRSPQASPSGHSRKNKSNTNKEDKTENKREAATRPSFDNERQAEITAAASDISNLNEISREDLEALKRRIDALLVEANSGDDDHHKKNDHPDESPCQKPVSEASQHEDRAMDEGQLPPQKPQSDAPWCAETVLSLIEFLRGQRYSAGERRRELRAALTLLGLKEPELNLALIEEAWRHGSDDYWRDTHHGDDVHVHDLVNQNSHGVYRVKAFLEHKRVQDQRAQRQYSYDRSVPVPIQPSPPEVEPSLLSEEQGRAIVEQIAQDAQAYGYSDLYGSLQWKEGVGWVVHVSWFSDAWNGDLSMDIIREQFWSHEFGVWHGLILLQKEAREKRRKRQAEKLSKGSGTPRLNDGSLLR